MEDILAILNSSVDNSVKRQQLVASVRYLIENDFSRLVQLLYRVDVSEEKLKKELRASERDSAELIADLLIARQAEKLKSRREKK